MKKFILLFILLMSCVYAWPQTVTLSFTGRDTNNCWVRLHHVDIINQTQNWSETIVWPDTTLTIENGTGIYDDVETMCTSSLQLFQNHPNPFNGTTNVLLTVADAGAVTLGIADVYGRVLETTHALSLRAGTHQFRITLSAAGTYVLTARQNGKTASIKMVNNGGGNRNGMEYMGGAETPRIVETPYYDVSTIPNDDAPMNPKFNVRGAITRPFDFSDMMEFVGYAAINGRMDTATVLQQLSDSMEIIMTFEEVQTDGLPCPGLPTLTDANGNVYHTVLVGSQCWMKENLRVTKFPDNMEIPQGTNTSNDPYYYDDSESDIPLADRGYLYNWAAIMHGASSSNAVPSGVQGVCPDGWHLPSEAEWEILREYVSGQPEYVCGGDPNSIAKAVASKSWWNSYAGGCNPGDQSTSPNNATGFSAVPAGTLGVYGYNDAGLSAHFWSATENSGYTAAAIYYGLDYDTTEFSWATTVKERRASVRCLRD